MILTKSTILSITLVLTLGFLTGACAKKESAVAPTGSASSAAASQSTEPATQPVTTGAETGATISEPSHQVYFAFDKSDLDAAARAILDANAEWLSSNSGSSITIEGNCDERGTREYNLALGQRRADSVRDYLVSSGVDVSRIDTISFGEERPACEGTGEACWAQNRRADIVTR